MEPNPYLEKRIFIQETINGGDGGVHEEFSGRHLIGGVLKSFRLQEGRCRYLRAQGCVFTGDALFCGSVGGTSSPKEAGCQVDHIRKNIFTLPEETLLFPAHGPMSTVGVEKHTNPFCL